jgi:hypothetical protein
MAKTLSPYIVGELQRLKNCDAPPTPAFRKSVAPDATDISKIVADFARATMHRIAEIDGGSPRMTWGDMRVLS